jgi:hypothetical protein
MFLRLKSLLIFQASIGVVTSNDEEFFNHPHWPNVLILGAQKAGTTTLYESLIEHPDVCQSKLEDGEPKYMQKEVHFFDDDEHYGNGPEWYNSKFSDCGGKRVTIEATPNYLNFDIARRMKETLPLSARKELKMIAILRNPVDRILSWYNHILATAAKEGEKSCRETSWCNQFLRSSFAGITPLNSGVRSTNTTIEQGDHLSQFISFKEFYSTEPYSVDLGKYADILEEFFGVFEKKNILVLNFDFFMSDSKRTLDLISNFLDIDNQVWDSNYTFATFNSQRFEGKKTKEGIDCKVIEEIEDFYQPYNRKLHYIMFKNRAEFYQDQPYFKNFKRSPRCPLR